MTLLRDIRVRGTFREPQFADLGLEHVPFDELTSTNAVERPLLDGIRAGSSAAVTGARGGGKSSVLAWVCRNLPDDHIPIRVPVVGMDDPSDPSVLGSVALGAALEAARVDHVELEDQQQARVEHARADGVTRRPSGSRLGGKLGGGPVPAEVSAELSSLETEYTRGAQPIDRLYGFDRLLGIFTYHGLVPVFVLEDTEAALGAGTEDATRDRFFTSSLGLLIREVDTSRSSTPRRAAASATFSLLLTWLPPPRWTTATPGSNSATCVSASRTGATASFQAPKNATIACSTRCTRQTPVISSGCISPANRRWAISSSSSRTTRAPEESRLAGSSESAGGLLGEDALSQPQLF